MIYKIAAVGKLKEPHYRAGAAEYIKRIGATAKIEITEIPAAYLADESEHAVKSALEKEAAAILTACAGYSIIPLCIRGRQYDSEGFSRVLQERGCQGETKIAFVIGGSHGLSDRFAAEFDRGLSLSEMTLPHELARLVLLEQLYRAENIIHGGKYHK
ncbi:ribosomal RNA large subunit methyltransferase H [Clostridia bacterium]|nr:ribosomal RNA large subunit methyltransferase H [Clostridia bacterium]